MVEQIDVHDLPEKEVQFIQQLVDLLKGKAQGSTKKARGATTGKRIKLPTYQLGAVHGTLSRREIYDYL
ncbi:MAG: hypothetical protein ACYCVH_11460 [Ignavibacteriaceae bacterium]